jgi:hypothetical protein
MRQKVISGISPGFPELSQSRGQVTHVLLTRSPLTRTPKRTDPFDLHVLSTPPAFVLSQDQTLHTNQWKADKPPPPQPAHQHTPTRTHHATHTQHAHGRHTQQTDTAEAAAPASSQAPTRGRQNPATTNQKHMASQTKTTRY